MKANLQVIKKGQIVSLQDKDRSSHVHLGVPRGGFIDPKSAHGINLLLGNKKNATVIEWALTGPRLKFSHPTYISLSHSSPTTTLDGNALRAKEKILIKSGSVLHLGLSREVNYQYLAIKGGFKTNKILGSSSSLIGYHDFENQEINYKPIKDIRFSRPRPSFDLPPSSIDKLARVIDAYPGPEYDILTKLQRGTLQDYFSLSNTRNRMGIQFNELIKNDFPSILSVPTIPGTIQLTPGGKLILLGKDCQTTGGYPRVLWLPEMALSELYQLASGVKFRFEIKDY